MYAELYCKAHQHNTRVLAWGYESWNGGSCPVTEFYSWARNKDPRMYNSTAVQEWANVTATCVAKSGFDGVMLDQEGIGGPPIGTVAERTAITYAVCELKAALNKSIPGSMVAWSTDTGPYFDYAAMTNQGCVDLCTACVNFFASLGFFREIFLWTFSLWMDAKY